MLTLAPQSSFLLIVDFQARLMPAIEAGFDAVANAKRLTTVSAMLDIPKLYTEQNSKGLGATVDDFEVSSDDVFHKMTFDATRTTGFLDLIDNNYSIVVAGCEAHVCVLQTVLGLLADGRQVSVVRDAIGSRRLENKEAALARMQQYGAEIVTTEMVIFEWLQTAEHPRFKDVIALIK